MYFFGRGISLARCVRMHPFKGPAMIVKMTTSCSTIYEVYGRIAGQEHTVKGEGVTRSKITVTWEGREVNVHK